MFILCRHQKIYCTNVFTIAAAETPHYTITTTLIFSLSFFILLQFSKQCKLDSLSSQLCKVSKTGFNIPYCS